jgi:Cft2 family RNA processing exonuclease
VGAAIIQFRDGGLWLPQAGLWLDPHVTQTGPERVFVSHAHADHARPHREVIVTAPTSRLMAARLGGRRTLHILPFGEAREFGTGSSCCRLTLLPAGHILGSAMALVEVGGRRLLYTGDFKLRPGHSAEPCDPSPASGCDVLIMETTFGRPQYRFPPAETVLEDIARFCAETIRTNQVPVLLAYSLGKSQELLCGLARAGFQFVLHETVWQMARVYQQCGVVLPPFERLEGADPKGKVVLCPPQAAQSRRVLALGRVRRAIVTGWALDASCRYRYQTEAAFPLSDHADYPDLVGMVERIRPRKVLTLHGFAADFARAVRQLGFEAQALSEDEQLELPL